MASSSRRVSNTIPDDLAFNILSKLPLKSLKRFRCVCKSWAGLFENPHFMSMYRSNLMSKHECDNRDSCLLFNHSMPRTFYKNSIFLLSGERFDDECMMKLELPPLLEENDRNISIMGSSINGTLCLNTECGVILWNPATAEFKAVPHGTIEFPADYESFVSVEAFGYDTATNDYKIIRRAVAVGQVAANVEPPKPIWQIYSLKSNSWRTLGEEVRIPCGNWGHCFHVYLNGICHWWGVLSDNDHEEVLVSYNLSNDEVVTTPLDLLECKGCHTFGFKHLTLLNGSIAMITGSWSDQLFHIWVLGEVGVKESWTKLFTFGPLDDVMFRPIGVGKKGDIYFTREGDEELSNADMQAHALFRFDINRQEIEDLGLAGKERSCQILLHKESFLPIGALD
ncbi:hypothetical protein PIB30_006815 [Stylosanthes scabra]|uniref:F-box domain-containing protein n=2 Tax=Stylosanthes scabra TaxID=79078 RepID=A0ABU6U3D2_9FABA|nr:hypothetical protein [Stylosanthes scabra]